MSKLNELLKPLRRKVQKDEPVVLLEEEFGYRNWIWLPRCSSEELVRWWKRQKNMSKFYFSPRDMKKGELFHMDWGVLWKVELFYRLEKTGLCWTSHLFDDTDSFLISPRGRFITHSGYLPALVELERYLNDAE